MISDAEYKWLPGDLNMGSAAVFGELPKEFTASQELPMQVSAELAAEIRAAVAGQPSMATREFLLAWDPIAQREQWRVPLGSAWWSGGGVLTTAGNLVIQGTADGKLVVYRADTGVKLHEIDVGTGIMPWVRMALSTRETVLRSCDWPLLGRLSARTTPAARHIRRSTIIVGSLEAA